MESKSKSESHSKIKTPSPSPPTSWSHSRSPNPKREVVKKSLKSTSLSPKKLDNPSSVETPEVQYLIYKLEGISLSQEVSESSEANISSYFPSSRRLIRIQSEKIGIPPFEFPLPPPRKKTKKSESETCSEILSPHQKLLHLFNHLHRKLTLSNHPLHHLK